MMLTCFWVRVRKVFELMLMMLACLWGPLAIGFRANAHDAGLFVVRWQKAFELMLMMLACLWVRARKVFELMLMMLACLWAIGKRLSS